MSQGPKKYPSTSYVGNGSQLVFPITFPFLQTKDLVVKVDGSVVSSNLTLSGGRGGLGTLTFAGGYAPADAKTVVITSIYSTDMSNAMIRRWNDLGCPIDGPMARESQEVPIASANATLAGGASIITNQVNQKLMVSDQYEQEASVKCRYPGLSA